MLAVLIERLRRGGLANVTPVLGRDDDPLLPARSCDLVLVVNTYHHFPGGPALPPPAPPPAPAGRPAGERRLSPPGDSRRPADRAAHRAGDLPAPRAPGRPPPRPGGDVPAVPVLPGAPTGLARGAAPTCPRSSLLIREGDPTEATRVREDDVPVLAAPPHPPLREYYQADAARQRFLNDLFDRTADRVPRDRQGDRLRLGAVVPPPGAPPGGGPPGDARAGRRLRSGPDDPVGVAPGGPDGLRDRARSQLRDAPRGAEGPVPEPDPGGGGGAAVPGRDLRLREHGVRPPARVRPPDGLSRVPTGLETGRHRAPARDLAPALGRPPRPPRASTSGP